VQGLGQGDTTVDTFVVDSAEGTDTTITVTILRQLVRRCERYLGLHAEQRGGAGA
jgi:hypothetical protein